MENQNQDNRQGENVSDQGTIQEGGTFQTDSYSDAYGQNQSDSFPASGKDRYEELPENAELPPLSEADTAPMFTDLGMGDEDPYNKADDEAADTMLFSDTHTAINTTENRSNRIAYDGESDELTMEVDDE